MGLCLYIGNTLKVPPTYSYSLCCHKALSKALFLFFIFWCHDCKDIFTILVLKPNTDCIWSMAAWITGKPGLQTVLRLKMSHIQVFKNLNHLSHSFDPAYSQSCKFMERAPWSDESHLAQFFKMVLTSLVVLCCVNVKNQLLR